MIIKPRNGRREAWFQYPSYEDLKAALTDAVKHKKDGAQCMVYGETIWAIGTATYGWDGCFTCITGQADHSADYEIDAVCYTIHPPGSPR